MIYIQIILNILQQKSSVKPERNEEQESPNMVKIEFEGKCFMKSKNNIVYNYELYCENRDTIQVGKWDDVLNTIVFDSVDSEEEVESIEVDIYFI